MKSILVNKILSTEKSSVHQIFETKGKVYTYLNPVSYLKALDNKELFGKMDGIFADGGLLVKAIKLVYGKQVTRRSFDMTSMAPELFSYAEEHGKAIYIVASKQEQVEKAVEIFRERYPKVKFAGYRNGYFASEKEMDEEAKHIVKLNSDFLIVGIDVYKRQVEFHDVSCTRLVIVSQYTSVGIFAFPNVKVSIYLPLSLYDKTIRFSFPFLNKDRIQLKLNTVDFNSFPSS